MHRFLSILRHDTTVRVAFSISLLQSWLSKIPARNSIELVIRNSVQILNSQIKLLLSELIPIFITVSHVDSTDISYKNSTNISNVK